MSNKAKEILIPKTGVFRNAFLYTGQGECTLMVIPSGVKFIYVLIDTNNDIKNGGIEVKALMGDLVEAGDTVIFINTHPHDDHTKGIKGVHDEIQITEVWHSGHKPGKEYDDAYQEMMEVVKEIGKANEYILYGTNDENKIRKSDKKTEVIKKIGDVDFIVLSPAKYVDDEIADEDADIRYNRIHEQSAVIKFSYGNRIVRSILITGDSDKTAWVDHITDYHADKLSSDVLSASHHGSWSFFKNTKDDKEIYEEHIEKIKPEHLIISAPKQSESKHGHPHDDAVNLYKKHVEEDNIYHLGKNRECVIVDITKEGEIEIKLDQELVKEYGFTPDEGSDDNNLDKAVPYIGSRTSRIDKQPMGLS